MKSKLEILENIILDSLSEHVIFHNPELAIQWANQAAADSLGLKKEDLLGKHCYELWHQRKKPCDICPVTRALETGMVQQDEITTPDSRIWFIKASPVTDKRGKIIGAVELTLDITQRKQTELALIKSEKHYRGFYENSLIGYWKTRIEDGTFIEANDAAVRYFGYEDKDEFVGKHSEFEYYSSDQRERLEKLLISGGEFSGQEVTLTFPDGSTKHILLSARLFPEDGYIQCTFIDITQRKVAEEALKSSEEHYRNLYDTSLVGHWRSRISDGKILSANASAAKIIGYNNPDELIGKCAVGTMYPNNRRQELLNALNKNGEIGGFELKLTGRDNVEKDVMISAKMFPEKGYIEGVVIDVSPLKKAENLLRKSEKQYRNVVENISDGLAIADFKEIFKFVNNSACRILGYTRDELIGMDLKKLTVPGDIEKILNGTKRRLEGKSDKYEISIIRKDGQTRNIQVSASPYYNEKDEIVGTVGIFNDITEIKKIEEERKKLESQLERARRMESIGILAGGVAHDLNNILGPLVAYPEMILAKIGEESTVRKQLEVMGICARDASEIIQDLLTLARRGRYEMIPTNLNEVIQSYLSSASFEELKSRSHGIIFETKLEKSIPLISGSTSHLLKIIMNLVVNAVDAMPNGGILTIETTKTYLDELPSNKTKVKAGNYVTLIVHDTGIGIDEKHLKHIFEPYFSKKEMGLSGSGLGLSVVYGILKDHKGFYEIKSKVQEGSEFILYFPMTEDKILESNNNKQNCRGNEKILVVDDSQVQRTIATDILSDLGYYVETAANGKEAVKMAKKNPYDLIILDMIMEKDFDGLDTYMEIIKDCPDQKAIVVSGFSATDRVNRLMDLGAGQYIKKPYTVKQIARAVREELDKSPITTNG